MEIENSLASKFTGSENAGKFILTFSDDQTRTPQITPIQPSDLDKQFLALQELLVQNILTAHRVTSPMLMGIKNETGLGSNVDELNSAGNYFLNTVCKPYQLHIIKTLRKLFAVNNMDMPISFVQLKPITLEFTSEDLKGVMTQDEIREELGLKPLNVEIREDFAKVGSMVTDGVELPLYDSIEEAEAEAKRIGCKGHHEHKQDGKTYYMPCESHDQITNLSKCNCSEDKKESFDFSELKNWITEYGEDIPEDWELIDEENADGEHEEFDFEAELNNIANKKIELASTGTARPNARSSQDGVNESFNDYYKVRYVYSKEYPGTPSSSRQFCNIMMASEKVYRKEDILQLTNKVVNDYYYSERQKRNIGWGAEGALTYSIWLYKGGGSCYHAWKRQIYKTSLRNAKANINSSQIISEAKARSEGFTPEENNELVDKAPKTMINEGFLEPR